jgi:uncharacterized repeat protein (TIGR03803 family)
MAQPAMAAWTLDVLHTFGKGHDGVYPSGGLIRHGHYFFGVTEQGGTQAYGTVFRIDAESGAERVLFNFTGGADGGLPASGVVYQDGALYGTTHQGGANGYGTVFKIDPASGQETVLYSFAGGTDAALPIGGLVYQNGFFYGTTYDGGASGHGTVFSFNVATGAEQVLYSFQGGQDGSEPYATPILVGGTLYGTTITGGASSFGTVYGFNIATGSETVLHSFNPDANGDGGWPQCALLFANGNLYGTAPIGGPAGGFGMVFAINAATGNETVLYGFKGGTKDGGTPFNGLIAAPNGQLYGTTQGGMYEIGGQFVWTLSTVFTIDPNTGKEHMIANFGNGMTGDQGYLNQAELLRWNGAIYGTTRVQGTDYCNNTTGCGTEFRLTPGK